RAAGVEHFSVFLLARAAPRPLSPRLAAASRPTPHAATGTRPVPWRRRRRFTPLTPVPSGANFQITRGSHAIVGGTADDGDLAGVVAAINALSVRAIRLEPR